MNVKQLIKRLEQCDPESEVYFAYDYGDRVSSQVCSPVREAGYDTIAWSEYHRQYALRTENDDDEDDQLTGGRPPKEVVVLA